MSTQVSDRPVVGNDATASPTVPMLDKQFPSLWMHVGLLAIALFVVFAVVQPHQPSISDEGAALAQVDALNSGRGWLMPHPFPALTTVGAAFPIDLSLRRTGTDDYAPLAKHPLYAMLLAGPYRVAGVPATIAVSVLGTLAAAVAAALIARRIDGRADRVALWLTGAATPLFYDGYLLIAHSLAAAMLGFAVLLLVSRRRRGRSIAVLGGLLCVLAAQLLRNEAVLLGGALSVALVFAGVRFVLLRRDIWIGIAVACTTVFGYRLDALWQGHVVGGAAQTFSIARHGSFMVERWRGVVNAFLRLPDVAPVPRLLLMATFASSVAAALCARRTARHPYVGRFAVGAALCATTAFVLAPPTLVPAMVLTAPVMFAGLLLVDRSLWAEPAAVVVGVTAAIFTLAVVATQYSDAGSAWGGRYFAVGLVLVTPLAAVGLARAHASLPVERRRSALVGAIGVSVALAAMAASSLLADHRFAAATQQAVAAATAGALPGDGDPRPVVIAGDRAFGRLLWPLVRDQRWVTDEGDLTPVASGMRNAGIQMLTVITPRPQQAIDQLAPWYVATNGVNRVSIDVPFGRRVTLDVGVVTFTAR